MKSPGACLRFAKLAASGPFCCDARRYPRCVLDVRAPARSHARLALAVWAGLIVLAVVWGGWLVHAHYRLDLAAPPFWSPYRPHVTTRLVPAVVVALAVIRFGPSIAASQPWRRVLAIVAAASASWAVALAYIDGGGALTDPVSPRRNDYLQTARSISSLHTFLSGFVDRIATYNQHTMGHPPGMVVFEWVLDHAGLATGRWSAAIVVAAGAMSGVMALIALRAVAGEPAARTAAPFVVLLPAAITWSTADAFFAGVSAAAVACVVVAIARPSRKADALAVCGGVLFGITAFLSYGLVLLGVIPATIAMAYRRGRPLLLAAFGAIPVFIAFASLGFWWPAGFLATRHQYWSGVAIHRPYSYFLFADLAVLAAITGPAAAVAFARLRDRAVWLLVAAALAVVVLADISGMSKAEVERIWLPFVPWLMLATAAFATEGRPAVRRWLGVQAASSLILAVTIWSQW